MEPIVAFSSEDNAENRAMSIGLKVSKKPIFNFLNFNFSPFMENQTEAVFFPIKFFFTDELKKVFKLKLVGKRQLAI